MLCLVVWHEPVGKGRPLSVRLGKPDLRKPPIMQRRSHEHRRIASVGEVLNICSVAHAAAGETDVAAVCKMLQPGFEKIAAKTAGLIRAEVRVYTWCQAECRRREGNRDATTSDSL